ncbi:Trimethylamine-N-oxide reductase (cytochrome c) [Desulfofundulus kuznetsovii DSM 6115]|uniref:Trimethylamine-N-oxide reductase (Cytochrome c) n=1 Tax=Desulfofundulus kuznetsovii (strain DSM 6115 / VKM B-1805 / 17) TaxID=760568 RepID=A0AAU8PPZ8_DESK7|nr:Trimethylamine-N-oxide reductase (cytochrome c) [Desulfofundulus kuznetsovii DSM 6115]
MALRKEHVTFCHICPNHCALKVIVEDGKVVEVKAAGGSGFPVHMCSVQKGADHLIGTVNSPDRLKKPLRRKGAKGEGKWEEISWDEALDTIAAKLLEVKEKYGPERVVLILGEPKGMEFAFAQRFATAFGTPNVITPGNYCGVQNTEALRYTFGSRYIMARMDSNPKVIVIWGANPAHTGGTFSNIGRYDFNRALVSGDTKLVVVDPKNIEIWPEKGMRASDADYWIRPRPNSDGILAMGMIKVIIEEKLYDREYIENWTVGFDELCKEVATFTLDEVEELTWVPKETIQQVARLYATNKPGIIGTGNALEGSVQAFQTLRAICILRGITGNVNTPLGGHVELVPPKYHPPGSFMLGDLKDRLREYPRSPERTICGPDFGLASRFGYVPTQALVHALLEEKPYLPKVGLAFVTNPLLTYPDSKATEAAFRKFELLVVSELFHTATTRIADIVLPAAFLHEHDSIAYWPAWFANIRANCKVVDPPGEAWSDMKIINELAKRVGLERYFWENEEQALDYMLKPLGLTWKQFRDEVKYLHGKSKYDPDKVAGYGTPSGKVEIYCEALKKANVDPLPRFKDLKEPLMGRFELSEEYPLIMTNYKSEIFMLSGYRNVEAMRKKSLAPTTYMNPETAKELGLQDGDWIYIETYKGKMKQRLSVQPGMHPKVVNVEFGWGDHVYEDANMNLITDYAPPWDYPTGSVTLRGYPCKVYKAPEKE